MASAPKTTEERLRELAGDIDRHEAAVAPPPPRPRPPIAAPEPLSPRARLARRILAWSIGLWSAFCFLIMVADERMWANPMVPLGMAVFMVFIGCVLYQLCLWQWDLAKAIAGWSPRGRKGNRAPD